MIKQRLSETQVEEEQNSSNYLKIISILPILVDESVYFTDSLFLDTISILSTLEKDEQIY